MLNKKNEKEKDSDINVDSIEEDIKILKNIVEVYENCSVPEIDMQVDITFRKKEINAIKTVLGNLEALCDMQMSADRELERQKQINEEHQKTNEELREKVKELENTIKKISESSSNNEKLIEKLNSGENFTVNQLGFIKNNFIPKQKIKDKIEELEKDIESKYYDSFLEERDIEKTIGVLEELLQEEDKDEL